MDDLKARLTLAHTIAREAGQRTLKYFQTEFTVERKADNSPVTIADRDAEKWLRQRLAAEFPHDGVLGEEFGETSGSSGYRWILDPIDGTKSFISGVPLYGTMVGVEHEGQAMIGAVYVPGLDEMVYAARGLGAWYVKGEHPPSAARVSSTSRLADGLFVTSQVDSFAQRRAAAAFSGLQEAAYITRTWGDCYGYLLVAIGRAEVMVDPGMQVWDAAAVQPIIEEAGGQFTDWKGQATIHSGEGVATNGLLHAEVLELLKLTD